MEHLRLLRSNGDPHEPPGSMPAALMAAAAAGEVRNFNNAFAASGSGAVLRIPAKIAVMACRSPGRGPSSSAPGTDTISLISWMPSSASPRATNSALGEDHPVARRNLALFHEVIDRDAGHDDIHDLAADDALHDLARRRENQCDSVSGAAFERAAELGQHVVHRTARQHLDFRGIGG